MNDADTAIINIHPLRKESSHFLPPSLALITTIVLMSDQASPETGNGSNNPSSTGSNKSSNKPLNTALIKILPQEVVDQIAAGEVVQRPASVIKELLENCLDAGSTHILIKVEKGGLAKLTIQDNGCGIPKNDLALAATRHATSKLQTVQDFTTLSTFGFRGEALASISMVSNLTITTRTASSPVAYTQIYRNGVPTLTQPRPGARMPGTTLIVQDLFHNVPHRLRTYSKRENDEYAKILTVVQHYAIHYPHCGFCLERQHSKGNLVDVNTSQLQAVQALAEKKTKGEEPSKEAIVAAIKAIMAHVIEPGVESHLSQMECSVVPTGESDKEFSYQAEVYYTAPSYNAKKSHFILFLNHRLVDLPPLKRSLEDVYADFGNNTAKSILVVNVSVPGAQVDVNVHPSKRQVALMYQEELCQALASKLKAALHGDGQSFTNQSVAPKPPVLNPYAKKRKQAQSSFQDQNVDEEEEAEPPKKMPAKRIPPSQLVRTSNATPVGAIEPFLVSTQTVASQRSTPPNKDSDTNTQDQNTEDQDETATKHKADCPLSKPDLSQPGAFAIQCTCALPESASQAGAVLVKRPVVRPKRVIPTKCSYSSIGSLRRRVNKHLDAGLARDLRDAYFVGVVSPHRSLVQCGEHLVMIHHSDLAKELFYQLALARFGGATVAQLGDGGVDGVDIETIIAQALQFEDDLVLLASGDTKESQINCLESRQGLLEATDTNQNIARQATTCLMDHADMLEEYFGIRIEKLDDQVLLTGLPVLLDGHVPEPYGLAIFLLRLATRVEWDEEKPCFLGVCRELGNYYALLPTEHNEREKYVRHTLFPAISYLLLPPEHFLQDGSFTVMTKLSTLYKVFERC